MKTVLIKDKKTVMPFDISSIRTLSYSETLRIDEVEKGRAEIQKALEETEKADSNEVNSLISLLSINKAEIPKQQELSVDTSILLNAINNLKINGNGITEKTYTINNEQISIGDEIMFNYEKNIFLSGILVGVTSKKYIVETSDKEIISMDKDSKQGRSLSLPMF